MINKKLFKLIKGQGFRIALIVLFMLLGFLGEIVAILGFLPILIDYQDLSHLWFYSVGGIAVALVFNLSASLLKNNLGSKVRIDLRSQVFKKVMRCGEPIYQRFSKSELTQLSMEGVENIDTYFSQFIPSFFYSLLAPFLLFIGCVLAYFYWPNMPMLWIYGLTCFLLVFLIPLSIMFVSRFAKKIFGKYWNQYLRLGKTFEDSLRGLKELKDFNASIRKGEQLKGESEDFRKATMKVLSMQLWSVTLMDAVTYGGAAIGSSIAVYFAVISQNLMTVSVALGLILISLRFFLPLRQMGSLFHVAMNGNIAGEKILRLLAIPEVTFGKEELKPIKSLEVKSLSYHYPDREEAEVLTNIDLSFANNGLYFIVGESGSGKSTFAKLLARSIPSPLNAIQMNGKDIAQYTKDSYFSRVGLLDNDGHLFFGTLRALFKFYKPDISDKEITQSLESVGLDYLLNRPEGFDFKIEENGANLSGGEKERLSLALSLLDKKDVLILDEITSSIDKASCQTILSLIKQVAKERLVIYITHNLLETKEMKNILVFKKGRVVQSGSFESLRKQDGPFKAMLEGQVSTMEESL